MEVLIFVLNDPRDLEEIMVEFTNIGITDIWLIQLLLQQSYCLRRVRRGHIF